VPGALDLFGERAAVREAAARHAYTGKTVNSIDHIARFFADRGMRGPAVPPAAPAPASRPARPAPAPAKPAPPAAGKRAAGRGLRPGATVVHPRYGRGTVVRKEGEGDEAKLTVSFPGHGLKKLVARFAGLQTED